MVAAVVDGEALLGEAQELLLVVELALLAPRQLDAAEVALKVGHLEPQQVELLQLALAEVRLARAPAQLAHLRLVVARRVELAPDDSGLAAAPLANERLGLGARLFAVAHARRKLVALGEVAQALALGARGRVLVLVVARRRPCSRAAGRRRAGACGCAAASGRGGLALGAVVLAAALDVALVVVLRAPLVGRVAGLVAPAGRRRALGGAVRVALLGLALVGGGGAAGLGRGRGGRVGEVVVEDEREALARELLLLLGEFAARVCLAGLV